MIEVKFKGDKGVSKKDFNSLVEVLEYYRNKYDIDYEIMGATINANLDNSEDKKQLEILNNYCLNKYGENSTEVIYKYILEHETHSILELIKSIMDLKDKINE